MNDPLRKPGATGPFHPGELRAHAMAGFSSSGAAIRNYMPDQHREFFAQLRFVLLASEDNVGQPHATVLSGAPGFIQSENAHTLGIELSDAGHRNMLPDLAQGRAVGLLGIDFATRRRNRANGVVKSTGTGELQMAVRQSFGNCAKYITPRNISPDFGLARGVFSIEPMHSLDGAARTMIAASDTFFVASVAHDAAHGGVDISHRGGPPGFLRVEGDTLTCPDYSGNRYFNTLGNFLVEPRAALLFIDFTNGNLMHLSGRTEIIWDGNRAAEFSGAERLWQFHVEGGWRCAA